MELEIYWTDFAKLELREIFGYYKEEANLRVAKNLAKGIVQSTLRLSTQPYIGVKEPLLEDREQEFRYLVYKNYKIIYWHNKEKNRIDISDVFDTRQNPIKLRRN
ncbi:MAG: type II toxin-antitoxin system RelE/ParE family toxin [Flavobacteriaceae bacterium]|nr:type II toxin-antitoxin system RelE/ParE family toxin [Flavobacteriaceae bacterium]